MIALATSGGCAPLNPAPGVATVCVPSITKPFEPVETAPCDVLAVTNNPESPVSEAVEAALPVPVPVEVDVPVWMAPIVPVQAAPRGQHATCPAASALHLALGAQQRPGAPMFAQLL